LAVEGELGQVEYLDIEKLKEKLTPIVNQKLNIDVVVLALP
jgi:hypothetical protein